MGAKAVLNRKEFDCWGQLPKVNGPEFADYMKESRKFGKAIWQVTGNKDVDLVFEHPGEVDLPGLGVRARRYWAWSALTGPRVGG